MTAADHANTVGEMKEAVLEWVRSRANPMAGPKERQQKSDAGRAALDALVAQADSLQVALGRMAERAEAAEAARDRANTTALQRGDALEAAEADNARLREALAEKEGQPIQNAARRLVLATDNAERNAALGDLVAALATDRTEARDE